MQHWQTFSYPTFSRVGCGNTHVVNEFKTAVHFGEKIHPNNTDGRYLYDIRSDRPKVSHLCIFRNVEGKLKCAKNLFLVCILSWFLFSLKKYLNWKMFRIKFPPTKLSYILSVTKRWSWPFFLRTPTCRNFKTGVHFEQKVIAPKQYSQVFFMGPLITNQKSRSSHPIGKCCGSEALKVRPLPFSDQFEDYPPPPTMSKNHWVHNY